MGKRLKLRPDINEVAYRIVRAATGEGPHPEPPGVGENNREAVRRGRKGGKKGGNSRQQQLTREERSRLARKAVEARWHRGDGEPSPS